MYFFGSGINGYFIEMNFFPKVKIDYSRAETESVNVQL